MPFFFSGIVPADQPGGVPLEAQQPVNPQQPEDPVQHSGAASRVMPSRDPEPQVQPVQPADPDSRTLMGLIRDLLASQDRRGEALQQAV